MGPSRAKPATSPDEKEDGARRPQPTIAFPEPQPTIARRQLRPLRPRSAPDLIIAHRNVVSRLVSAFRVRDSVRQYPPRHGGVKRTTVCRSLTIGESVSQYDADTDRRFPLWACTGPTHL